MDHTEIHECLPSAAERAIHFVKKHLMRRAEIGSVRQVDHWSVPEAAVREAIINAILHADYSQKGSPIRVAYFDDRPEIENPGILPFGLTIGDLRNGVSKLRNRVIGRVFKEFGLIEQCGSGIQRMTGACSEVGLPEPFFGEVATRFRVTIRLASTPVLKTDPVEESICRLLKKGDGMTPTQIAREIGLTPRATRSRLRSLRQRGIVTVTGRNEKHRGGRYFLSERGGKDQ
jgi:ATP-dependent DNA helicase RecG